MFKAIILYSLLFCLALAQADLDPMADQAIEEPIAAEPEPTI